MTVKAEACPGACGFTSLIKATRLDKKHVSVKIKTSCEKLNKMNDDLNKIDWSQDIFSNIRDSAVYNSADKHSIHTDCPVPSVIIKAIQIELESMLPVDVSVKFEKIS